MCIRLSIFLGCSCAQFHTKNVSLCWCVHAFPVALLPLPLISLTKLRIIMFKRVWHRRHLGPSIAAFLRIFLDFSPAKFDIRRGDMRVGIACAAAFCCRLCGAFFKLDCLVMTLMQSPLTDTLAHTPAHTRLPIHTQTASCQPQLNLYKHKWQAREWRTFLVNMSIYCIW